MGFSKPVVASRHGGLPEIVQEGETGRLFSPGSAAELSAVLREFLANRDTYRSYGTAGRLRFERLFTTEQSNRAFVAATKELVFGFEPAVQARPFS
jgi:glycosyltransferase involved in cell wall biosynthesis